MYGDWRHGLSIKCIFREWGRPPQREHLSSTREILLQVEGVAHEGADLKEF